MAKIAMLLTNPFVSDQRVYREARSLVQRGHSVTVYAWDREGEYPPHDQQDDIQVERFHIAAGYGRGIKSLTAFIRFGLATTRCLLSSSFDIVHCHDLDTMPFGYLIARLRGKPVIFDAHEAHSLYTRYSSMLRRIIAILERWMARRADHLITVTPAMVSWYSSMGVHKITLVANYADSIFDSPEGPVLQPADKPLVLGWIGHLKPGNQLELVIEAVKQFGTRHKDNPLRLLLVGPSFPGYKEVLLEQAKPLGDRFTMVGPVSLEQVPTYYRQIDIAVIVDLDTPHNRIALAMKLFESMAMGIPVIVPSQLGEGEFVSRERCGLVIGDYEVDTIVEALEALSSDPHARLTLGRNGWQAVKERYNWSVSAQALVKVYDELLSDTEEYCST